MSDRLTPRVTYTVTPANVGKKRFDFLFKIYDENDLKVVLSDGTTPSGTAYTLAKTAMADISRLARFGGGYQNYFI